MRRTRRPMLVVCTVLLLAAAVTAPDARATGPARLSVGDVAFVEGDTGTRTVRVTLRLTEPLPSAAQVAYATADRTATAPADYTAKSGTITIPAGQTTTYVAFPVKSDNTAELDERFAVVLTGSLGAPLGRRTGFVTILDDDHLPTTRASVDSTGGAADSASIDGSISADGRYVAFDSTASDLVPGDGNGFFDVFVRDLFTGTTTRVSVDTTGGDPDAAAVRPSVSADGRYVAFDSAASDLVTGDGNGTNDVYVRDVVAGTTTRVSVDTAGGDPDASCVDPSISADGRYVAFSSPASDLVTGDGTGDHDVFVRDLLLGTTTRVSVDTNGGDANHFSSAPSISGDGRRVAFQSFASDLVPGDGNGVGDVFVRDLLAGATTRVSVDTTGGDPNSESSDPSLSADGQSVAFDSIATDLVSGDGNGVGDVFVRDLVAGRTTRASVDTAGGDPNSHSFLPSLGGDGRFVGFQSTASDLVAGDGNGVGDVFVRDLLTGTTTRVSVDTAGSDPDGPSHSALLSDNGRSVVFASEATDLIAADGNTFADVFVRLVPFDVPPAARVSVDPGGGEPDGASFNPSVTGDGRYVAFESDAANLVAGDGNPHTDVFVRDGLTGTTVRASVDSGGDDPDGPSANPSISADGRYVAFDSSATDLVIGDGNSVSDVFVRDLLLGTTVRASVDTGDNDANGPSFNPSVSGDGTRVAFESDASDLVTSDGNSVRDIFVFDLNGLTTTRVSEDSGGFESNGPSFNPSISADGPFVAFESDASDLVGSDGNAFRDVFRYDMSLFTIVRVSVDTTGGDPDGASFEASISGDGSHVAFQSNASDLVTDDLNGVTDVFRRDVAGAATSRVSVDLLGHDTDGASLSPSISADDRYVAFHSFATDITPPDNAPSDVFRRDLVAGATVRVSIDTLGGDANGASISAATSADGRHVAFFSAATDLVTGDGNGAPDVFVRDLAGVFASIGDAGVAEGDGGATTAYFTLSLDRTAPGPVVVAYTTFDGTATAPADYTEIHGTKTIPTGDKSVLIAVTVRKDRIREGDHRFSLKLTGVTGARVARGYGTGTILDDDSP